MSLQRSIIHMTGARRVVPLFFDRPMSRMWREVGLAWKTQCNKTAMLSWIRSLLPPSHVEMMQDVEKAINIAEDILFKFPTFPGCPGKRTKYS